MALRVGVIGGGLSGTLLSMKLFMGFKDNLEVTLFERKASQVFRGVAYSSSLDFQPLNVQADHMNLWHEKPGDFYAWLKRRWERYYTDHPQPDDFVRRDIFGDYVQETFLNSLDTSFNQQAFDIVFEEVKGMNKDHDELNLLMKSGSQSFDYVILALGNFLPGDIPIPNGEFYQTPFYQANPWNPSWIKKLNADDDVLILGTGLTAVDQMINLIQTSHRGKIYVLSRRGLLPLTHQPYASQKIPALNISDGISTRDLFSRVRKLITILGKQGVDWRNVIDTVRNQVPEIWNAFTLDERKRFLRHVRPYWEIHRHRIPQDSYDVLQRHIQSGKIEVIAGRLEDIHIKNERALCDVKPRRNQPIRTLSVNKVVNCTGPQTDFRKIDQPLIQDMLTKGWIQPDELNLGLSVNEHGQLMTAEGKTLDNVFTIGSLRKGALWECTALREIALQADEIVSKLKNDFSSLDG